MDAAVHLEASLSFQLPPTRTFDTTGDDSFVPFAANMSSFDDMDEQESDVSRPHGDESARSSSVTTPDIPLSRPPPPPPFDSKHSHVSSSGLTTAIPPPPPPQTFQPNGYSQPPPPPPPPPHRQSKESTGRLQHPQQNSDVYPPPPPPPPPDRVDNLHLKNNLLPPPPPPPPSSSDRDTPRAHYGMNSGQPPPPPPRPISPRSVNLEVNESHDVRSLQRPVPIPRHPATSPLPKAPSIPTSEERSHNSRDRQNKQKVQRGRGYYRDRYPSASGSSTYSNTRPADSRSSVSESSSEEDPILYRNARQFPPLLPAAPGFRASPDSKASITNRITTWVAQYERARSPHKDRSPHGGRGSRREPPAELILSSESDKSDVIEDDKSEDVSDASSEGEVELLWTQLKEKRARLNDIKTEMASRRKQLRDLRRKKDDADNAFMSVIRPILVNQRGLLHTPPNLLDRRLADMQSLRNEYHFLESTYEGLEVMLDEEEELLNSLETRFFSLLAAGRMRVERPPSSLGDSDNEEIDKFKNMPFDLKGISSDGPPEDLHPLYRELTSTIGDLENAKEEYEDLLYIKDEYQYDLDMKQKTGKIVSADEKEFFSEFPGEQARMLGNIERLDQATKRLRLECEEKGVMRRHMSTRMTYLLYPDRVYEDIDLDEKDDILASGLNLAHHKFPVLLTQPDHVLAEGGPQTPYDALKAASKLPNDDPEKRGKVQLASKEYAIDRLIQDHGDGGKIDFVNRWLLQQLRTSPMNVALLHSTFIETCQLKIRDFWRWQSDVLHYWWQDDMAAITDASDNDAATSEGSEYASRVGTPQLSRAASDQAGTYGLHRHDVADSSEGKTIYGDAVFPHSYPTTNNFPHSFSLT